MSPQGKGHGLAHHSPSVEARPRLFQMGMRIKSSWLLPDTESERLVRKSTQDRIPAIIHSPVILLCLFLCVDLNKLNPGAWGRLATQVSTSGSACNLEGEIEESTTKDDYSIPDTEWAARLIRYCRPVCRHESTSFGCYQLLGNSSEVQG